MLPSASQYFRSLASVEKKAICKKCGIKLNLKARASSREARHELRSVSRR